MGLIAAALGSVGGVLADQWKEYFYCEAMDKNTLVMKGQKQVTGRSTNTKGSDNIITNGSGIAVADGQCMIIVDDGKIVEVCAEPGKFIYDTSTEPSIFYGGLGKGIVDSFKKMGERIALGGATGHDQRIYYFNTKEILDNKFGTANPIMFRVVDNKIGLDLDTSIRCNGVYSYKITDPLLFYTNVCGNVSGEYTRDQIDSQLKTEFVSALQPAMAKLSAMQMRPNEIPAHAEELSEAMNAALSEKWAQIRGISVVSIAMNPITIPEEDADLIKQAQRAAMYKDPTMAGAATVAAQTDAMKLAAQNSAGAMTGFMGLGFAQQAGGVNAANLYAMGAQQQAAAQAAAPAPAPAAAAGGWTCACGTTNQGNFCTNCGQPKPAPAAGWTCACGTTNTGNFCTNCGQPKPAADWTCSCGTVNSGKFCTNCGKPRA